MVDNYLDNKNLIKTIKANWHTCSSEFHPEVQIQYMRHISMLWNAPAISTDYVISYLFNELSTSKILLIS